MAAHYASRLAQAHAPRRERRDLARPFECLVTRGRSVMWTTSATSPPTVSISSKSERAMQPIRREAVSAGPLGCLSPMLMNAARNTARDWRSECRNPE